MALVGDDVTPFHTCSDGAELGRRLEGTESPRRLAAAVMPTEAAGATPHMPPLPLAVTEFISGADVGFSSPCRPRPSHTGEGATAAGPVEADDGGLPSQSCPMATPIALAPPPEGPRHDGVSREVSLVLDMAR